MKVEYDFEEHTCKIITDDGVEQLVNYKLQIEFLDGGQMSIDAWSKTKSRRKLRREHFKKTGEVLKVNSNG
jgi:hypothetical protein|tara:strand:- start:1506 stop:1718 length:213 start_codon:yes stop_codon:yes gene_type:complete